MCFVQHNLIHQEISCNTDWMVYGLSVDPQETQVFYLDRKVNPIPKLAVLASSQIKE